MDRKALIVALVAIALGLGPPPPASAEVPKPGMVVNKTNLAQYKEVTNPTLEYLLSHGWEAPIIETMKIEWPPAYKEATEKYSSQVQLSPDGRDLVNWVAGAPFPTIDANDPQAGAKWMWNHEHKTGFTDNVGCGGILELIDASGMREKFMQFEFWRRMFWEGRLYMDPKPVIPHQPAVSYTEIWGPFILPNELKGAGFLTYRYKAADKPDDSYLYLPELRKVRRISVASRSDALFGTDIDMDAAWSFNSKLSVWDFKFLGEKKMISSLRGGGYAQRDPTWRIPPDGSAGPAAFAPTAATEIRDTIIVEGKPIGMPQYAFSKRILYIDKETYIAPVSEAYDHGGQLWKAFYMTGDVGKEPHDLVRNPDGTVQLKPTSTSGYVKYDHDKYYGNAGTMIDFQLNHATRWDCPDGHLYPDLGDAHWYSDVPKEWNNPSVFTVNYLIKAGGI